MVEEEIPPEDVKDEPIEVVVKNSPVVKEDYDDDEEYLDLNIDEDGVDQFKKDLEEVDGS